MKQHDVDHFDPGHLYAGERNSLSPPSHGAQLGWGEGKWLMNEISLYNVPVKRRCFPIEAARLLRGAMDETLSLALSLHHSSPLHGLHRVLPLRSLPEAAPPPSTKRLLGKLRGRGALKKVLCAKGRGNRDAALGGSRGTSG